MTGYKIVDQLKGCESICGTVYAESEVEDLMSLLKQAQKKLKGKKLRKQIHIQRIQKFKK